MDCQRCGRDTVAEIHAKCADSCHTLFADGSEESGVLPLQVGSGDHVHFCWCTRCGQIQGIIDTGSEVLVSAGTKIDLKHSTDARINRG